MHLSRAYKAFDAFKRKGTNQDKKHKIHTSQGDNGKEGTYCQRKVRDKEITVKSKCNDTGA